METPDISRHTEPGFWFTRRFANIIIRGHITRKYRAKRPGIGRRGIGSDAKEGCELHSHVDDEC